jgi:hypothetical protein
MGDLQEIPDGWREAWEESCKIEEQVADIRTRIVCNPETGLAERTDKAGRPLVEFHIKSERNAGEDELWHEFEHYTRHPRLVDVMVAREREWHDYGNTQFHRALAAQQRKRLAADPNAYMFTHEAPFFDYRQALQDVEAGIFGKHVGTMQTLAGVSHLLSC